jgi:opacity protein-like surface antigen
MRKLLLVFVLTLLVSVQGRASGLAGYYSYLESDDFGDGNGFGAKLVVGLLPWLDLDTRAARVSFDDLDLTPFEAALSLALPVGPLRPYVGAGGGYYRFEPDIGDSEDEYGWFAMVGVEAELAAPLSVFAEARWLSLEATIDDVVDDVKSVDRDYNADGLGFNVGAMLRW